MTKTASEIRHELKERTKKRGKVDWFGLKEGTAYLRIGPPWKKNGDFWKDVLFHGGFKDKVYCRQNDMNEETGKPKSCIICKRVLELKNDRSTRGKKLWSLIRQKNESLWNVLVAKIKRTESGVKVRKYIDGHFKVWRLSSKWHNMLIEIFADEDLRAKSILGVTHPKYGRLIKAKRSGTGRDDTNYTFLPTDKMTLLAPEKSKRAKLLKTMVDLDKMVHASSKEELEAFLEKMEKRAKKLAALEKEDGHDRDDDDEEEEDVEDDEEETSKKHKKHHKRDVDDDDDDSDDSDSDSEDDDDEDSDLEKKYKKMKKKSKKDEEDEDEDSDEEEEEEDDDDE